MRTYADALPLQPLAAGGSNEGVGYFADGRETDPSFETHKNDLNLPNGHVSSFEHWRKITRNRVVRIIAMAAFTMAGATACGDRHQSSEVVAATRSASTESDAPDCYDSFLALDGIRQADCRALIAEMEQPDIHKLKGLDKARWASYYRHAVLGESSVLHNSIRTRIIDDPSGAESAALHFLTNHQTSVYRLAWLMQHKPQVAQDTRTHIALLGSDNTNNPSYKMATYIAQAIPSQGMDANEYVQATSQTHSLFTSVFAQDIRTIPQATGRIFRFTAEILTPTGTPQKQTFTYTLHPYVEVHVDQHGLQQEKSEDPDAPGAEIFAQLGKPLLAEPVQISNATS